MRERPILFTPENIRAIVEGRKTQTRRVLNWPILSESDGAKRRVFLEADIPLVNELLSEDQRDPMKRIASRYGRKGDRLWVKEGWGLGGARLIDPTVNYRAGGQLPLVGHADPETWSLAHNKNRHSKRIEINDADLLAVKDGWHNAMFMPRWAARLLLEITAVRIERVQDISEEDAIAEGLRIHENPECAVGVGRFMYTAFPGEHSLWELAAKDAYRKLWDSINGKKHPWSSNPWVWALTFKRVQ